MKKIYFILFILSLLSYLSKSVDIQLNRNTISKLIGKVREELVDKSLLYLPSKNKVNILEMGNEMKKAIKEYSLSNIESAYLVFKWINQNLIANFSNSKTNDATKTYNLGKGSPKGMSSVFSTICGFLDLKTESISGYLKWYNRTDRWNEELEIIKNYTWNIIEIDGELYLIDVSMAYDVKKNNFPEYMYWYFGTYPEIFIRLHFPYESKYQLLSKSITLEKFESMAMLNPSFYLYGFKNISPDTNKLSGTGKIILTSNEFIPAYELEFYEYEGDMTKSVRSKSDGEPNGIIEIDYDIDDYKGVIEYIRFYYDFLDSYYETIPLVYYSTSYSKFSSWNFNLIAKTNLNIQNEKYLLSNFLRKSKSFKGKKYENMKG